MGIIKFLQIVFPWVSDFGIFRMMKFFLPMSIASVNTFARFALNASSILSSLIFCLLLPEELGLVFNGASDPEEEQQPPIIALDIQNMSNRLKNI